jgi:hypothetical protein
MVTITSPFKDNAYCKALILKQITGDYFLAYCLNLELVNVDEFLKDPELEKKLTSLQLETLNHLYELLIDFRKQMINQPFIDPNIQKCLRQFFVDGKSYYSSFFLKNGGVIKDGFEKVVGKDILDFSIEIFPFLLFTPYEKSFSEGFLSEFQFTTLAAYSSSIEEIRKVINNNGRIIISDSFPDGIKSLFSKFGLSSETVEIGSSKIKIDSIPIILAKNAFFKSVAYSNYDINFYLELLCKEYNIFLELLSGKESRELFIGVKGLLLSDGSWFGKFFNILEIRSLESPALPYDVNLGTFTDESGRVFVDGAIIELKNLNNLGSVSIEKIRICLDLAFLITCKAKGLYSLNFFVEYSNMTLHPPIQIYMSFNSHLKVSSEHFSNVEILFLKLIKLDLDSIKLGIDSLLSSARNDKESIGFIFAIIFWENLFGEQGETTFKICNSLARIYKKIEDNSNVFDEFKKIYNTRSRYVHGNIPDNDQEFRILKNRIKEVSCNIIEYLVENDPELLIMKNSSLRNKRVFEYY